MKQRHDLGNRIAGEKGQLPDEFLTRSQVLPGKNIRFDYLDNHDILINAETGVGANGLKILRSLTVVLCVNQYPDTEFKSVEGDYKVVIPNTPVNEEQKHIGWGVNVDFPAIRQHHLFRPEGVRVFHNWGIQKINPPDAMFPGRSGEDNRCRYIYSVTDASGIDVMESVVRCFIDVYPIDGNSVIVRRRNCAGAVYPEGGSGTVNYGSGNVSRTRLNVATDTSHRFLCGSKPFIILNLMEVQ